MGRNKKRTNTNFLIPPEDKGVVYLFVCYSFVFFIRKKSDDTNDVFIGQLLAEISKVNGAKKSFGSCCHG